LRSWARQEKYLHKLRHIFASILVALGVDPGSVMDQLGYTGPGFTPRVYRHGMRHDAASKEKVASPRRVTYETLPRARKR
jgi:integrase